MNQKCNGAYNKATGHLPGCKEEFLNNKDYKRI